MGGIFKRVQFGIYALLERTMKYDRKDMKETGWCGRGGGGVVGTRGENPSYGGSKGHPEVFKGLPVEWQVAHFHTYLKHQKKV